MTREDKIEEYKNTLVSLVNRFDVDQETTEYLLKTVDELLQQPASPGCPSTESQLEVIKEYLCERLQKEIDEEVEESIDEHSSAYVDMLHRAKEFIQKIPPPQPKDCEQQGQVQQGGCEGALKEIQRMLRITDKHSEYGLTEHERGWKSALLLLRHNLLSKTTTTEEAE